MGREIRQTTDKISDNKLEKKSKENRTSDTKLDEKFKNKIGQKIRKTQIPCNMCSPIRETLIPSDISPYLGNTCP